MDSGAVFCRLLDADEGAFFRVGPTVPFHMSRRYRNGTALLDTDFSMEGGSVRVTDFMHSQRIAHSRLRQDDPQCHRLLRRVEGLAGECEVELVFRPTFDFAREPAALVLTSDGVRATGAGEQLQLRLLSPSRFDVKDEQGSARLRIRAGECAWIVMAHADAQAGGAALEAVDPDALLDETERHWHEWDAVCSYDGPFVSAVRLSARVLKLLTFGPTGALVAAPTTSLPEAIGGVRNWDYRFCWL